MTNTTTTTKNTIISPTEDQTKKTKAFKTRGKSNSFPSHRESTPNVDQASINLDAKLKHSLSSPSLTFTYTSMKDLIPHVKSPRKSSGASPVACGFSHVQSAHDIAVSNHLVRKAAWAYLQPMPTPSTSAAAAATTCGTCISRNQSFRGWIWIWNELKSPMDACLKFINNHILMKITHVLDVMLGAIRA